MAYTTYSTVELKDLKLWHRGKVRDVYEFRDKLLIIATDRISAFDCVLPNVIPYKGQVLTQLTEFWLRDTAGVVPNHRIATRFSDFPEELRPFREQLIGRSMLVIKTRPFPVECVVRGYLAGSGWKDYQKTGMVCGIRLPAGLRECDRFPDPIFTPSTKAQSGHDENISTEQMAQILGSAETARRLRDYSLRLYQRAADYAAQRGIIIADTKFEFGLDGDRILLIDEVLTPDSSRFWPARQYQPGRSQPSFDKQYVRDYLETLSWDKRPPAPELPPQVVQATSLKYLEAHRLLTGKELAIE
ncbi:MAG TPA: phosphoribosylaminoimidazolesuccinocarboxamide synthase [Acidobacteriota bacterium]|jgi:phosphoribosylaminoimidazole-succinocarboxamide synthase